MLHTPQAPIHHEAPFRFAVDPHALSKRSCGRASSSTLSTWISSTLGSRSPTYPNAHLSANVGLGFPSMTSRISRPMIGAYLNAWPEPPVAMKRFS
jgi:hypothetical protein